ncbi:hypothetical protein, partial [Escherichia coli]|uniref:hypothetical protein n=1 Tax=Escherichia coli TaxID=562 RepID=UPI00278C6D1A
MARTVYTYSTEPECPCCGNDLKEVGTVTVNGHEGFVDENGIISEAEDTNICLVDGDPEILCADCKERLLFEIHE